MIPSIEMPYSIYLKFGILLFLGLLLFFWLAMTLGTWLGYWEPLPKQRLITVVLAALLLLVAYAGPHSYSKSNREQIEVQGTRLITAIEDYRSTYGAYPSTLEAAGISAPQTPYGPIRYSLGCGRWRVDPTWYCLNIAYYDKHGFEMAWDNRSRNWWLDS